MKGKLLVGILVLSTICFAGCNNSNTSIDSDTTEAKSESKDEKEKEIPKINDPDIKKLDAGEIYQFDLDGDGNDESVSFEYDVTYYPEGDEESEIRVYIDDVVLYMENFYNTFSVNAYLVDLDTSDDTKEIIVEALGDSETLMGFIGFRYSNEELRTILEDSGQDVGLIRCEVSKFQKGDGSLSIDVEFDASYLGQGFVTIPFSIEDGEFIPYESHVADVSEYWQLYTYTPTDSLTLYSDMELSKDIGEVDEGEVFYIKQLYCDTPEFDFWSAYITRVYIETESGKKGWIEIPNYNFFSEFDSYRWG